MAKIWVFKSRPNRWEGMGLDQYLRKHRSQVASPAGREDGLWWESGDGERTDWSGGDPVLLYECTPRDEPPPEGWWQAGIGFRGLARATGEWFEDRGRDCVGIRIVMGFSRVVPYSAVRDDPLLGEHIFCTMPRPTRRLFLGDYAVRLVTVLAEYLPKNEGGRLFKAIGLRPPA